MLIWRNETAFSEITRDADGADILSGMGEQGRHVLASDHSS